MHETLIIPILAATAACCLSFAAGWCWAPRRNVAIEEAIEAAICNLDERLAKVETVVLLSDEV